MYPTPDSPSPRLTLESKAGGPREEEKASARGAEGHHPSHSGTGVSGTDCLFLFSLIPLIDSPRSAI